MILRNSAILAFFSILSLLLAILRDRLLAGYVGVGPVLDIYNASFRIPDLMYGAVLAFVTSGTVVPFLTKEDKQGNIVDPQAKLASLSLFFIAIMGLLAFLFAVILPYIAHILVPGFSSEQVEIFILTTRLLLVQPILLGITSLISCLAQMKNQFILYGLSPLGYSVGIIFGIVELYPVYGIFGLIYGVLIGTVISLSIQAYSLRGVRLKQVFYASSFSYIRELSSLALPRTGTNVTTQLRQLFFHGFATTLGPGVLSAYLFAQKITDSVVQVIQQSVTTVSIPILSKDITDRNLGSYKALVKRYVVVLGACGVGAGLFLYTFRDVIINILYGVTGSNGLISFFLMGFIVALPFQMMSAYFVISLYSARDSKDVFITYLISSFLAVAAVYLFRSYGKQALVGGYCLFWVTNFLIIYWFYSRKRF